MMRRRKSTRWAALFLNHWWRCCGSRHLDGEITKTAVLHGRDLLLQGLTVSQVGMGRRCMSIRDELRGLNAPTHR